MPKVKVAIRLEVKIVQKNNQKEVSFRTVASRYETENCSCSYTQLEE